MATFFVKQYTDKSFVLRSNPPDATKQYTANLVSLGGKYNPHLQGGAGWIFGIKQWSPVITAFAATIIPGIEKSGDEPISSQTVKIIINGAEYPGTLSNVTDNSATVNLYDGQVFQIERKWQIANYGAPHEVRF